MHDTRELDEYPVMAFNAFGLAAAAALPLSLEVSIRSLGPLLGRVKVAGDCQETDESRSPSTTGH